MTIYTEDRFETHTVWTRKPKLVGSIGRKDVYVRQGYYTWRYCDHDGGFTSTHFIEYSLPDPPPLGFKPRRELCVGGW